jgi:hypothetical protein
MERIARALTSILLVAFAVAPLVYAHDSCSEDGNASIIDDVGPAALGGPDAATMVAVEQAANIGDSNAAMSVAAEQAANIGDSNAAMLVAAEQAANIGESTLTIEHAATFGDPEDAALVCYFGPC